MVSLSARMIVPFLRWVQKNYFSTAGIEEKNFPDEYVFPAKLKLKSQVGLERYKDRNFYILTPKNLCKTTVFYFHGGGYVLPFFPPQWKLADKVASKTGAKVIAFDYPMMPKHTYKETYDIFLPYYEAYTKEHPDEKIVFMGDSAGGALSAGMYLECHRLGLPLPNATILISPYLDIIARNPESKEIDDPLLIYDSIALVKELWAKDLDDKDPRISPLFGDLPLFHNTCVITGTRDILHPDSKTFIEAIKGDPSNSYLIKEGMFHVYPIFRIREAKQAIKLILKKIEEVSA